MKRLLLATVLIARAHARSSRGRRAQDRRPRPGCRRHIEDVLSSRTTAEGRGPGTAEREAKAVEATSSTRPKSHRPLARRPGPEGRQARPGPRKNVPLARRGDGGPDRPRVLRQGQPGPARPRATKEVTPSPRSHDQCRRRRDQERPDRANRRPWRQGRSGALGHDFKGLDVKGRVLVVLISDPDFETGSGDFGGKAMTYYGR
ncbi:hypothetical protein ACRAWD_01575 [Caulobacter segnis]